MKIDIKITNNLEQFMYGPKWIVRIKMKKIKMTKVGNDSFIVDLYSSNSFKRQVTKLHTLKRCHFKLFNIMADM